MNDLTAARLNLPGRFGNNRKVLPCLDCHIDTWGEYFIVHHDLWHQAVGHRWGYLCVLCLEHRLGRLLTPDDFLPCPANDPEWRKTDLVRTRMS